MFITAVQRCRDAEGFNPCRQRGGRGRPSRSQTHTNVDSEIFFIVQNKFTRVFSCRVSKRPCDASFVSLFVCFFLTVGPKVTFFQPEDEVVGREDVLNGECEVLQLRNFYKFKSF